MHACRALTALYFLLAREEGESGVIWSLAFILMAGAIAVLGGSYISPAWREFVGRPLP